MDQPSEKNLKKMWSYAEKYAEKSGSYLHPDRHVTEGVVLGLSVLHQGAPGRAT